MKHLSFFCNTMGAGALVLVLGCLVPSGLAEAPKFLWAQRLGGTNQEYGTRIAVDSAGSSYAIGKFSGPTMPIGGLILTNGGIFIAKFDITGNVTWARQVGPASLGQASATGDWVPEIAADNAGHAYLLGPVFYGAVDFGETNFTTTSSIGFFLAAYTSSGGLAWARVVENVYAAALVVDGTGNSLVTGVCGGDSFGTTNFTSTGNMSIFTAKFDPAGNVLWIKGTPGPGTGFNAPKAIALGPSGDFYLCGEFEARNISFGSFTLTNSGDFDVFVVCCDFSGGVLWARQGGGTNRELAIGLSVDAAGACYLTGAIDNNGGAVLHGSALFGGCMIEDVNFFLVKYSLDGEVLWCRKAGVFSIDPTVGLEGAVLRSSGDADGNSYLLGQFYSIATFDTIALTNRGGTIAGTTNYPSHFAAKLNAGGNVVWAKGFGGADTTGNWTERSGIASDAVGHLAIAGFIAITNAIFDDFTLSPVGGEDVFVARLDANRPKLELFQSGNSVIMSWPTNERGFMPEGISFLPPTNGWVTITNAVAVIGGWNFVTNPMTAGSQYYRLRKY